MNRIQLDDVSFYKVAAFFAASKNLSFRRIALMRAQAIAEVFTLHGLAACNLLERYTNSPQEFSPTFGELTDNGFKFVQAHLQPWLASSDRWKGEITYEKLRAALLQRVEKFREEVSE